MPIQEMFNIPLQCRSCPPIVHENNQFIEATRVRDAMVFDLDENDMISEDDRPSLEDIELQNEKIETRRKNLQKIGARTIKCSGLLISITNPSTGEFTVGICDSQIFTKPLKCYEDILVTRREIEE